MKRMFFYIVFVGVLFTFNEYAESQIITTIVGGGSGGGTDGWGTGLPAINAILGNFCGITADAVGNLYIADKDHSIIRRVDATTTIITTIAGTGVNGFSGDGGPATAAQINSPGWIAFDSHGNLFFSDRANQRIRKIDGSGIITTIAGNGTPGFSGDGGSAATASLFGPQGICIDRSDNLYITDNSNHRVRKVNTTGIITTMAGNGIMGDSGDGGLADTAEFEGIYGIRSDTSGNIYVADWNDNRVRMINAATGIIYTIAGNGTSAFASDYVTAVTTGVNSADIAIDDTGNLYIADFVNNRIRKVNLSEIIYTVAGDGATGFAGDGGPATLAVLNSPAGLNFDPCGNLLIADNQNHRVRKVTYPGPTITLTSAITSSSGDTACTGTAVSYTATATASTGSIIYQWYVNGIVISGATTNSYIYIPADGDSIRCVATATNTCTSAITSSNTINMVVNPYTVPTITVTAPASVPIGSTVTVNATVAGAGSGYSINWYDNSVLFNTTTVPVVTYIKGAGTDHITATVVPVGGCYDSTTSAAVSVVDSTTASPLPSAGEWVSIYPNPVVDLLHVDHDVSCTVRLVDVIGVCHSSTWLTMTDNIIDVSRLAEGIYMVEVTTTDGQKIITKIVKE